jgi:uncharacterized protein (TIGR02757 family)
MRDLKRVLLSLEKACSKPEFLATDPVEIPQRYAAKEDREYSSLVSALFAYGNVKSMRAFLRRILPLPAAGAEPVPARASRTPAAGQSRTSQGGKPGEPYYRFQTAADVVAALRAIQSVRDENGSFEVYFREMKDLFSGVSKLQRDLLRACPRPTRGLVHLFGDPEARSARKRYCMFLRWMVRRGFPDFGLYDSVNPSQLVVPLDTHMIHMADNLSILKIRSPSFQAALALTDAFRRIDHQDPLRFDFALTRPGITGICRSRFLPTCRSCSLRTACRIYAAENQKE